MNIRIQVCNTVPTKHSGRILHPKIEIEDRVMEGETPIQCARRLSVMANAMFAREVLDQLRYADRMEQSNEQWCDEYLSTVAEDHPALNLVPSDVAIPDNVLQMLNGIGEVIGNAAVKVYEEGIKPKVPTPPEG